MTEQIGTNPMDLVPDRAVEAQFALEEPARNAVQRHIGKRRRGGEVQQAGDPGFTLVERRLLGGDLWRLVYFTPTGLKRTIEVSQHLIDHVVGRRQRFIGRFPGEPRSADHEASLPELLFQQASISEGGLLSAAGAVSTPEAADPAISARELVPEVETTNAEPVPAPRARKRASK